MKNKKGKKYFLFFSLGNIVVIALLFILIFLPILGTVTMLSGEEEPPSGGTGVNLSPKVLAYEPLLRKYAEQYGILNFVQLFMAVMQQESAGQGLDPMQSSECPYNTQYPNSPNAIKNPDYSIQCGVQYVRDSLIAAGCTSPTDIALLSLALQGYNYGNGYISWAQKRGGYTKENALEFSMIKREEKGWTIYGDPSYVDHVLRYFNNSGNAPEASDGFAMPLMPGTYRISQPYKGSGHWGIDLGAGEGVPIYAAASGTVYFAGWGYAGQGFGGYGNAVCIDHGNGYYTVYGHCSALFVQTGQTVAQGQKIGEVGNTGNSFGNHLHFEIRSGVQYPRLNPSDFLSF